MNLDCVGEAVFLVKVGQGKGDSMRWAPAVCRHHGGGFQIVGFGITMKLVRVFTFCRWFAERPRFFLGLSATSSVCKTLQVEVVLPFSERFHVKLCPYLFIAVLGVR